MRFHVLAPIFLSALAPLAAQSTPGASDTAAVTAVVERFHAVLKTGDTAVASQLIADDAIFLEAGGVETRAEYLMNHLPADAEFEKAVTNVRGPIRVVVVGDAAWATSTSDMTGTFQNRPVNSIGAELMVLSRQAGTWRIRVIHWSGRAKRPAQ
jgi:ketosteroid isomerase-like protein